MKKIKLIAALMPVVMLIVFCGGCNIFQSRQAAERPLIQNTYVYDADKDDYLIGLAAECMQSSVAITTTIGGEAYAGSGVVIGMSATRTYIITNNHVVSGESLNANLSSITVKVTQPNIAGTSTATILDRTLTDPTSDLAIIWVAKETSHTSCKYSVDALKYGQHVLAVGNGLGYGVSVCDGLVSNPLYHLVNYDTSVKPKKLVFESDVIQISAPINSGNSGGGLFDMKANLIGINTFKAVNAAPGDKSSNVYADSISFTLPMQHVYDYVDKWNKSQDGKPNPEIITMTKG